MFNNQVACEVAKPRGEGEEEEGKEEGKRKEEGEGGGATGRTRSLLRL